MRARLRPPLAPAPAAQRGNCGRRTFPLSTPSSTSSTRCVAARRLSRAAAAARARAAWATFPFSPRAAQVDTERFPEAKKELDGLLSTEALANTPFLILGNKIDRPYAVSEDALRRSLGLLETTGADVTSLPKDIRPIEVFMCSILRKTGYADGLKWLTHFL